MVVEVGLEDDEDAVDCMPSSTPSNSAHTLLISYSPRPAPPLHQTLRPNPPLGARKIDDRTAFMGKYDPVYANHWQKPEDLKPSHGCLPDPDCLQPSGLDRR